MVLKFFLQLIIYLFLSLAIFAEANLDQWQDSEKTYYDLVQEGYEVKAYDISKVETNKGYLFMFFVSVLQKENQVYECQEYQTLDENMQTINTTFVCRKLVQPYIRGLGT